MVTMGAVGLVAWGGGMPAQGNVGGQQCSSSRGPVFGAKPAPGVVLCHYADSVGNLAWRLPLDA